MELKVAIGLVGYFIHSDILVPVDRKTFKSVGDKCEFIVLSNGKEQDAFYGSYNGRRFVFKSLR